ncbi:MAG: putative epimerase/dehydratase [Syntrophaceae bacterium PtaB.Bin038]|nr:MAG: putative epimerase/dehydratase [Syntrophaceae bacterium PtaB.Bin038]
MATLITGGAGFIGSCLASLLIDDGEKPVIFDLAPVRGPLAQRRGRFVFEPGNLAHLPVLMDCVERHGIDRIFHLGGMLSLPSESNHWGAFDANVVGTVNILEAARIKKMRQVVYGSTIATYSRDIPGDTIDDRTIQRPSSFYGVTKTFGELAGRWYHRRFGVDFRGVRLPSIVGPGAKTAHMSIYNAWAIEFAVKGLPYEINCSPETRCPALYYKDAAMALKSLSEADPSRLETRVYNIAGITPPYSAQELVDVVARRIPGARLSFRPDPVVVELLRELGSLRISDECARAEWGWRLSYPLEAMVEDFIGEFEKNRTHYL